MDIFSLKGKTILITGASSGIGMSIAIQCAKAGAKCILTARNEDRLCQTYNNLKGDGHSIIMADLMCSADINKLIGLLPCIDGIVCCAGIVETKILKFTDDVELNKLFSTNVFSNIRLIRELVINKRLCKESSIVIISSISGVRCGYVGGSIYGATKGAMEGFMKAAALELAQQKIRVNSIIPGMIETPLMADSEIDEELLSMDRQKYPLKRYGKAEEVAYAAIYLLCDATKWVTGTSLLIDGGYTLN
jgi:NAD(P)-dependent dehydrogenase (short-subunit alcohol dehydrogenase family)